jgi:hypothetical protein
MAGSHGTQQVVRIVFTRDVDTVVDALGMC